MNLNSLFLNSTVFIYICLQQSQLNDIFIFVKKKNYFPDLFGNIGCRFILWLIRCIYTKNRFV
jgi:hypothetical protein